MDRHLTERLAPFEEAVSRSSTMAKLMDVMETKHAEREKEFLYWRGGEGEVGDISQAAADRLEVRLGQLRGEVDEYLECASPDMAYFMGDY